MYTFFIFRFIITLEVLILDNMFLMFDLYVKIIAFLYN